MVPITLCTSAGDDDPEDGYYYSTNTAYGANAQGPYEVNVAYGVHLEGRTGEGDGEGEIDYYCDPGTNDGQAPEPSGGGIEAHYEVYRHS